MCVTAYCGHVSLVRTEPNPCSLYPFLQYHRPTAGAPKHTITQRGETAEISEKYIYQHLGETQSHRTADGWRRKRKSRERKIKRRHLVLNEGMENADRNKLSDSSGPLRETDRRETVCTEVQEDKKKRDGRMDG